MANHVGVLMMLSLSACAGEDTPAEKCDELIDVVCDRAVACIGGDDTTCVQSLQSKLPCGSAKSVAPSYDRCLSQLESNSCTILFPTDPSSGKRELTLPADCRAVILTRELPESPPTLGYDITELSAQP